VLPLYVFFKENRGAQPPTERKSVTTAYKV